MSQKKIKKAKQPGQAAAATPQQPQMTKEQQQYIQSCQSITEKLSKKLAKAVFGPAAKWEKGAEEVDRLTAEIGHICMQKFKGLIRLDELIVFFGYIVGHQAGIGAVKTKKSLADARFVEAGKLFEAAVRLGYVSLVTVMQHKIQVAKSIPKPRV